MGEHILVVDDEPSIVSALSTLLESEFDVFTADSAESARNLFQRRPVDLILADQKMPQAPGVELLEWVRQLHPRTVRLLMTAFGELDEAVAAINRGQVFRFIFKPWRQDELLEVLADLRAVRCDVLTLGQYLAPTLKHIPVARFVPPEEFDALAMLARSLGFAQVASGPFVRSSYHADEMVRG